ncbi:MAG: hypothetical protein ACSHW7_02745 [Patiriisocius sp.]|uniref:hypothetical protein n=1 Tax=Patiriisocius sp. TaxID=2822396 RepID=UPI003EF83847
MHKNKISLLLVCFMFIVTSGIAQKKTTTVYTNSGKTYQVKSYSQNKKGIFSFKTVDGERMKINLSDFDKVEHKGKKEKDNYVERFIYYKKNNGALMTEITTGPKATLYHRSETRSAGPGFNSTIDEWRVLKAGEKFAQYVKGNNVAYGSYENNIRKYFKDCPKLIEKIENDDFNRRELIELVEFYNNECE